MCACIGLAPPLTIAEDFAAACMRTLLLVATELRDFFFLVGSFGVVAAIETGFEIALVASVGLEVERATFFEVTFVVVTACGSSVLLADLVTGTFFSEAATFI